MVRVKSFFIQLVTFIGIIIIFQNNAHALRCLDGSKPSQSFKIDEQTNLSKTHDAKNIYIMDNTPAGTIVWQSSSENLTFTCYDDYKANGNENLYLYLDDLSKAMYNFFNGSDLELGVLINGEPKILSAGGDKDNKVKLNGYSTSIQNNTSKAQDNCTFIEKQDKDKQNECFDPVEINVSYSLFLQKKDNGAHLSNKSGTLEVFQIDGEKSKNPAGNFQSKINIDTITYIDCVPNPLIESIIDLGIYQQDSELNTVLREVPVPIKISATGENCATHSVSSKFTSVDVSSSNKKILHPMEEGMKDAVNIRLKDSESGEYIQFDNIKDVDLGKFDTNNILSKNFLAEVFFTKRPPVGQFSATLNFEVWFK